MEPEPPLITVAAMVPVTKPSAMSKLQPGRKKPPAPVEHQANSGAWERAIENLHARQRELARRAQFSQPGGELVPNPPPKLRRRRSAPLPSEQDAQARERFAEFWDDLIPHKPPAPLPAAAAPPPVQAQAREKVPAREKIATREKMKPLPRSVSLVVIEPGGPMSRWARAKALVRAKQVKAPSPRGGEAMLQISVEALKVKGER
jgi:hypothetical protein